MNGKLTVEHDDEIKSLSDKRRKGQACVSAMIRQTGLQTPFRGHGRKNAVLPVQTRDTTFSHVNVFLIPAPKLARYISYTMISWSASEEQMHVRLTRSMLETSAKEN